MDNDDFPKRRRRDVLPGVSSMESGLDLVARAARNGYNGPAELTDRQNDWLAYEMIGRGLLELDQLEIRLKDLLVKKLRRIPRAYYKTWFTFPESMSTFKALVSSLIVLAFTMAPDDRVFLPHIQTRGELSADDLCKWIRAHIFAASPLCQALLDEDWKARSPTPTSSQVKCRAWQMLMQSHCSSSWMIGSTMIMAMALAPKDSRNQEHILFCEFVNGIKVVVRGKLSEIALELYNGNGDSPRTVGLMADLFVCMPPETIIEFPKVIKWGGYEDEKAGVEPLPVSYAVQKLCKAMINTEALFDANGRLVRCDPSRYKLEGQDMPSSFPPAWNKDPEFRDHHHHLYIAPEDVY